ncbi:MAG: acyl-CoA thioesterase [Alishewanella agri]|nr:acyl-CoA thioesterase [Alishewanella agri]
MMHRTEFKVRDYECDMQGIVNNAVYFNYLEHARHEFLHSRQIDFAALARAKVNLVVVRAEMDYKASLTSGDQFYVTTQYKPVSRLRFGFKQQVWRSADKKLMLEALITGTALNEAGKPFLPPELQLLLD